jgi:hypothetical protein
MYIPCAYHVHIYCIYHVHIIFIHVYIPRAYHCIYLALWEEGDEGLEGKSSLKKLKSRMNP